MWNRRLVIYLVAAGHEETRGAHADEAPLRAAVSSVDLACGCAYGSWRSRVPCAKPSGWHGHQPDPLGWSRRSRPAPRRVGKADASSGPESETEAHMAEQTYSDYRTGRYDLTGLDVHIPCVTVGGETLYGHQACACGPNIAWPGHDVGEVVALCNVCARGPAGGTSKWSWMGCACCRVVELELRELFGICVLPLGRHSIMNGVSRRLSNSDDNDSDEVFAQSLNDLAVSQYRLYDWGVQEARNLAQDLVGSPARVALQDWLARFPASPERSVDAYERFLGMALSGDLPQRARRRLAAQAEEREA